jgi:hypothetical protein
MIIKKYLNNDTGKVVIVFPWDLKLRKAISKNPQKYSQMFEEC